MKTHQSDFLIIGSGIAGLLFALDTAQAGRVTLVTKKEAMESNTNHAQGGIAAVLGTNDSFDLHIQDTLASGAGLSQPEVVRIVVEEGPLRIKELVARGVSFSRRRDAGAESFDLGREGGHSRNRIVHTQDIATGDGLAMAYRAGATLANLEFVQFHPTCLYHPEAKNFLISEAVRGEGAVLLDARGQRFLERYDPARELACRDVVARAIDTELKKSGDDSVFLDISGKDAGFIRKRFPNLYENCLKFGIDMTRDPIPVVPAAHYMCGGVVTDTEGRTDIRQLYAVGETACTGLHGANRLASNSLLEALVYAHRAARQAIREFQSGALPPVPEPPAWDEVGTTDSDERIMVSQNWDEIRRFMWSYVGIVRSDKRLERARRRIEMIQKEITDYYWNFKVTGDLIELRNIAMVAELIIRSASHRKESRGLHYNILYPARDDGRWQKDTILRRPIVG